MGLVVVWLVGVLLLGHLRLEVGVRSLVLGVGGVLVGVRLLLVLLGLVVLDAVRDVEQLAEILVGVVVRRFENVLELFGDCAQVVLECAAQFGVVDGVHPDVDVANLGVEEVAERGDVAGHQRLRDAESDAVERGEEGCEEERGTGLLLVVAVLELVLDLVGLVLERFQRFLDLLRDRIGRLLALLGGRGICGLRVLPGSQDLREEVAEVVGIDISEIDELHVMHVIFLSFVFFSMVCGCVVDVHFLFVEVSFQGPLIIIISMPPFCFFFCWLMFWVLDLVLWQASSWTIPALPRSSA